MVEHLAHPPGAAPLSERETTPQGLGRGGLCLICGEWAEADAQSYAVVLRSAGGDASEHVAHVICVARVTFPGIRLPAAETAMPDDVAPNYLDPKPRTPEGR